MQCVTEACHGRNDDEKRRKWVNPEHHRRAQTNVGREDDQVAMRDIDQAHDPENQRQPCREQGIETPEERSLNHRPDPFDHWATPK